MKKHVELITDNNRSTCLTIPNKKPVQLVAEMTVNIPFNNASDNYVVIEIQLSSVDICENIMFMNLSPLDTCTPAQKVEAAFEEILPRSIANQSCYFKVPLVCQTDFCEAHVYLAFKNNASVKIKLCEVRQG